MHSDPNQIASFCYPCRPGVNNAKGKPTAEMYDRWQESSEQWNRDKAAMAMFPLSVGLAQRRGQPLTRSELEAIHCYPGMGGVPTREEMWPS